MAMAGIGDDLKAQWDAAVANFSQNEQRFRTAMQELTTNRDKYYAAGLGSQFESVFNRGQVIQSTVEQVLDTVRNVYGWLKDTFGLGLLPALPLATLAGVATVIGGFLIAYQGLNKAYDAWLISQVPVEKRGDYILDRARDQDKGFAASIQETVIMVAVIAAIAYYLRK